MSHRGEWNPYQVDRVLLSPLQLWDWRSPSSTWLPIDTSWRDYPILREEVEAAVKALKMGKSVCVDNIQAELVQAEGEAMIDILTSICSKIWKTGEWPTTWSQSLVITLPKKDNLQLCQNYRTISLISHPSKVMLKIILNRHQSQAEEIIADEQAQVSEPEGARQNKYSISGSSARNISRTSTMSSQTSGRPLTVYGTKPYGQLWGNTTSTPALYEPLKICIARPRVQSCSMTAQENSSELQ